MCDKFYLELRCRICLIVTNVEPPVEGYERFEAGDAIQDALPTLSAGERELILSRHCGPCYEKLYPQME